MAFPLPPWLSIQPTDFQHALASGTAIGMQIAAERNRQEEAAARQALAARELSMREWEAGEQMRLKQQALEQEDARTRAQMAALDRYRLGELELGRGRLAEQEARNKALAGYQRGMLEAAQERLVPKEQRLADEIQRLQGVKDEAEDAGFFDQVEDIQSKIDMLSAGVKGGKEGAVVELPEFPGYKFWRQPTGHMEIWSRPDKPLTADRRFNMQLAAKRFAAPKPGEEVDAPTVIERQKIAKELLDEFLTEPIPFAPPMEGGNLIRDVLTPGGVQPVQPVIPSELGTGFGTMFSPTNVPPPQTGTSRFRWQNGKIVPIQ